MYYFNARYYDSEIGRFISVDPARDGLNWYAYAAGNPLRYVDPTRLKAGDRFLTVHEAAIDFAMTHNDDSIIWGREFGATIYATHNRKGVIEYSYSVPYIGGSDGTNFAPAPEWAKAVALIHTHGSYALGCNEFSSTDRTTASDYGLDVYVSTPNGSLKVWPNSDGGIISESIWSDPDDPDRKIGTPDGNEGSPDQFCYQPIKSFKDLLRELVNAWSAYNWEDF